MKSNHFTYQRFSGHFEKKNLKFDSVSEREQTVLTRLKTVIEDLSKHQ